MAPSLEKESLLEVKGLSLAFKQNTVLQDFSLKAKRGEFIGIVGKNGSGKSTLALYLAGVIPELMPATVSKKSFQSGKVGLVMQNPSAQFFALTVKEELQNIDLKGRHLNHLMEKTVFDLSEGQKQKINLVANAFNNCEVLLLDEPLELLDPLEQKKFWQQFEQIRAKGNTTIIWFDKDEKRLPKADRIIHLSPKTQTKNFTSRKNFSDEKILQASFDLKLKDFELKGINFELKKGEKIALIGANGAGKTLLLKALAGIQPVKGKVEVKEKIKINYSPQNPSHQFYEDKVKDVIELQENIERFGLQALLEKDPSLLSKGQKKLVSVAATGKGLLLLDEPTTWLDDENKGKIYQFIAESSDSMVISTHDPELLAYCDKVYLINGGLKACSNTAIKQFFQNGLN